MAQVAAARKGLRNQLKNMLWRTKGASGSGGAALQAAAAQPCGPGTLEGSMRSLADLAFMLQACPAVSETHSWLEHLGIASAAALQLCEAS